MNTEFAICMLLKNDSVPRSLFLSQWQQRKPTGLIL